MERIGKSSLILSPSAALSLKSPPSALGRGSEVGVDELEKQMTRGKLRRMWINMDIS